MNTGLIPLPQTKYLTIVIDPPWPMQFIKRRVRPNQISMPYPTMSVEEIKSFPINQIADNQCDLFLWTTQRFLPEALALIKAWKFKYHVLLTWDKQNGLVFFGIHRRTEFVIYAYKGKPGLQVTGSAFPAVFTGKARQHSRKPDVFYQLVKEKTLAPRLDIFSREKRDGFDQWGNETDKFNSGLGGENDTD